jgi:hypothetical protein
MERELGISYPTVRGRVDALVRALGLAEGEGEPIDVEPMDEPASETDDAAERRVILERLARREIGAEEAAAALRELGES